MEDLTKLGKFVDSVAETTSILAGLVEVIGFQDSAFQTNNKWLMDEDGEKRISRLAKSFKSSNKSLNESNKSYDF